MPVPAAAPSVRSGVALIVVQHAQSVVVPPINRVKPAGERLATEAQAFPVHIYLMVSLMATGYGPPGSSGNDLLISNWVVRHRPRGVDSAAGPTDSGWVIGLGYI